MISIHAPARGATTCGVTIATSAPKFQSTHPRGVRLQAPLVRPDAVDFNPRTREGCDIICPSGQKPSGKFQSTHPRGVRPSITRWTGTAMQNFNPRTREGCDHSSIKAKGLGWPFQSTHPRGVRQKKLKGTTTHPKFQSTHPRGVRRVCSQGHLVEF